LTADAAARSTSTAVSTPVWPCRTAPRAARDGRQNTAREQCGRSSGS
jgi:hypothetical protein